jgi:hypothetical protein
MNDEMTDFYIHINRGTSEEKFTGSSGIITCADAMADTICYIDGAATGCTAGRVGPTEALIFQKGTAEAITEEEMQERHISPNVSTVPDVSLFIRLVAKKMSFCQATLAVECSVLSWRRMAGAGLDSSFLSSTRKMECLSP